MIVVLAALALLQQGQAQQQPLPGLKDSPVTRITISPTPLVVAASDSIQLTAVAYDASGKRVDNAGLRFSGAASNGRSARLRGQGRGARDGQAHRRRRVADHRKAVASYTPEYGGVHNVWVAGDTLYLGAYDGGFHVFDISGELRGDLRAQDREIAHLQTADMEGNTKNAAFTWDVVVNPKDGLAYVNDYNNGLWVVKVEPRPQPVP
ncbi:MAG: hypothetical protein HOQ31_16800 [Gemmatimonadaceae bacterium]|nr:hypothetical protein [Gemmatimonadaceae bacterium]NUO96235.1 hypothetical protein [Gemmatimonadaceae bacterium]NUP72180.1 hypothetical protein [Gemmatimonadaceae bacterium]NUR35689.1 hypothetical protein [Gemmatimonadaceae bacterium]NUS46302.1 hypothetical protein [Gemmatimonadaceae bacterium]